MSKPRPRQPPASREQPDPGQLSPQVMAALATVLSTQKGPSEHRDTAIQTLPRPGPVGDPEPPVPTVEVASAPVTSGGARLSFTEFGCAPLASLAAADPQALGVTYWAGAPPDGPPSRLEVAFHGRRLGVGGTPSAGDRFIAHAVAEPVLPGAGRVALTHRIRAVTSGRWQVMAKATYMTGSERVSLPTVTGRGETAYAPVLQVRAPGVRIGAWPLAVGLGALVGLATQVALASRLDLPALRLLVLSLVACLLGVVGAKAYYLATHRREKASLLMPGGMSLQGFVLVAIATVALGSVALAVPLGLAMDVTASGLLLGAAIGRFGCFFGGCCAGRPTASRWGRWSSNRRLGVRRIPVQLMDAAVAGSLGLTVVALLWWSVSPAPGVLFVGSLAAYIWARQFLFAMRDEPRITAHGRTVMRWASAITLIVAVGFATVMG